MSLRINPGRTVLPEWWQNKSVRAVPLLLALSILTPAQDDAPLFHSGTSLVHVDVQAFGTDRKPVSGLKKEDFLIFDQNREQEIVSFGFDEVPLDLVLLVDISGSMTHIAEQVRQAAVDALPYLKPQDRVGVVAFGSRQWLIAGLTEDRAVLEKALRRRFSGAPGTELNMAVYNTARYLKTLARKDARRAILILTDNNGGAAIPDQQVRDLLWETNTVFNALIFPASSNYSGEADTRRFAKATGGEVLKAKSSDLRLGEMFDHIRRRYSILYRAPEGDAGAEHRIKVKLSRSARKQHPAITLRARPGYISPKPLNNSEPSSVLTRTVNTQPHL
jgi:VWFA-related protein